MKSIINAFHLAAVLLAASLPSAAHAEVSDADLQRVVQRLQLLEDREAIRSLLERYIDYNETRDYRGYSQLFASTGELQTRRGSARGPEAIFKFLDENFGGPLPPDSMLRNASHVLSNIIIDVDGDTATARSRWVLLSPSRDDGTPRVAQSGFYSDKLVRENGEWRFQERRIITGIPVPAQE